MTALTLFASMFAPWFSHEDLGTPRERFLRAGDGPALELNGWELYGALSLTAVGLLAVLSGLGAAAWLDRRGEDHLGVVACAFASAAALAALLRIVDELRAPSDYTYTDPRWGIYAGLAASAALVLSGVVATFVARSASRRRQQLGSARPILAAAAVTYGLAVGAAATDAWEPYSLVACCVAAVVGYAIGRWWLLLIPLPLGMIFAELAGVEGLGVFVMLTVVLLLTGALTAGVAARVLQDRLARNVRPVP